MALESILMRGVLGVLVPLAAFSGQGCNQSSSGGGFAAPSSTTAPATSATPTTPPAPPPAAVPPGGVAPIVSAAPPGSGVLASGTFRALTYNVAGLPQGISSSNPTVFIPQISPLLNAYDLVLAQEDFVYHVELASQAQHPFQSPPLSGYTTLMPDGLNRFSAFPFVGLARVKWSTCHGLFNNANDCLASKGFSVARHEIAPGVTLDVYNLHADAGNDSGDVQARTDQFAQLDAYMQYYSPTNAVIVAGDFNLKRSRAADLQVLQDFEQATGLQDVSQVLPNTPDHIDRFYFRSTARVTLTPLLWRLADEFVDASGNDLSDHPAIHVDFEWQLLP